MEFKFTNLLLMGTKRSNKSTKSKMGSVTQVCRFDANDPYKQRIIRNQYKTQKNKKKKYNKNKIQIIFSIKIHF